MYKQIIYTAKKFWDELFILLLACLYLSMIISMYEMYVNKSMLSFHDI